MLDFDFQLLENNSSQIFLQRPDGLPRQFNKDTAGVYRPYQNPLDISATKITTPVEQYDVLMEDDTLYRFQKIGDVTFSEFRIVLIKKQSGYQQTIAYNAAGQLTTVTDNLGRTLTFVWTGGLLTRIQAPGGINIDYTYEFTETLNGQPVVTTQRLKTATVTNGTTSETTTYHHENAEFPYALTGITDARGVRYKDIVYDSIGRVIESGLTAGNDRSTFSYTPAQTTVTNALGKRTLFTTRTVAGVRRLTGVDGVASTNCPASATALTYTTTGAIDTATDEEGRVTKYIRDTRGRPTSITKGFGTPEATTTTYTYHPTLRAVTQMVEPGRTTNYAWDAATGRLTSRSEVDTTTHSLPYSTNGQTRTWTYTYATAAGLLATADGPLAGSGDTMTYAYDANGYVSSVTNEVGHVTTINTVNARGQPTRITDPNGVITDLTYDFQGRLKTTTVNPGVGAAVTSFDYNAVGDITRITRPDGSLFDYAYNNARRLTSVTALDGQKIEYTHDLLGNVLTTTIKNSASAITYQMTQTYDELGRLLKQIGANTQETRFGYEKNDNLKTVTDPRNEVYSNTYDAVNRLIRETDPGTNQVNLTRDGKGDITAYNDPRNITTSYVRNGFGETIRRSSPDSGVTDYVRDARGLETQMTDGRGIVTSMTYDNAGRNLTKSFPSAPAENITFVYDAIASGNKGKGRLTSTTHQGGSVAMVYDVRGNLVADTRVIGGRTYATSYAYDAADNLTLLTYPSGRQVEYLRDTMGRVTTVRTRKPSTGAWSNVASGIVYQPLSLNVKSFTHGNGLATTNTHTLDYELSRCRVTDGALALIDKSYTRADKLNITSITDNVAPANSLALGYNKPNRLQSAAGPWGNKTFTYDGTGNRTSEVTGATTDTLSYPVTSNRISNVLTGVTTTRTFTHDGAGNIATDTRSGSTFTYGYNARGRLATVSQDGNLKGTYVYNSLEQLASRVVTNSGAFNGTVHTTQDRAGNVIAEADGSTGVVAKEYIWLPGAGYAGTDLPVGVVDVAGTATPELLYVHADHLGRPIRLTDPAKVTAWAVEWLPWGGVHSITGSETLNARFPGQWFQVESGLHYNWHRHYDPSLGRYTQPDPLGFVDGPSVYAYARNAPGEFVDPDGRNSIAIGGGIGGAVGGPGGMVIGGAIGTGVLIYQCMRTITCEAKCNVQEIRPGSNCPDRVYGTAKGKSKHLTCVAAQKDANSKVPPGCYKRHCNCDCN